MAKLFKVLTKAVIDGQPVGSTIELNESTANRLAEMKYVAIIEEVKPKAKKATSAPKKPAKKSAKKATEAKTKKESEKK